MFSLIDSSWRAECQRCTLRTETENKQMLLHIMSRQHVVSYTEEGEQHQNVKHTEMTFTCCMDACSGASASHTNHQHESRIRFKGESTTDHVYKQRTGLLFSHISHLTLDVMLSVSVQFLCNSVSGNRKRDEKMQRQQQLHRRSQETAEHELI